jgi:hypothetical protein
MGTINVLEKEREQREKNIMKKDIYKKLQFDVN